MPFISTVTSAEISAEREKSLKEKFGKAIEIFPGKTERWLMLSFSDNARLWFAGSDAPCAMVEVKLFGSASAAACEKMTAAVCEILSQELGLSKDRIYVKYEACDSWGWNGGNF